jgi:hypothetical protein
MIFMIKLNLSSPNPPHAGFITIDSTFVVPRDSVSNHLPDYAPTVVAGYDITQPRQMPTALSIATFLGDLRSILSSLNIHLGIYHVCLGNCLEITVLHAGKTQEYPCNCNLAIIRNPRLFLHRSHLT